MTENEIEKGLTSLSLEVRKSFAENKAIFKLFKSFQIKRGLADENPLIRYVFAKMCFENRIYLGREELENGLKDTNSNVQALFIKEADSLIMTDDYIDLCLKNGSAEVKIALLRNLYFKFIDKESYVLMDSPVARVNFEFIKRIGLPTTKEERDALWHKFGPEIKTRFAFPFDRDSVNKSLKYSRYELERGLIERHSSVRTSFGTEAAFYRFNNINSYQLERGLMDRYSSVRYMFSSEGFQFYTEKQIARGLMDENSNVRLSFIRNTNIKLTSKQGINIFNNDVLDEVKAFANRVGGKFTPEQVEMGLTSKYHEVRMAFAGNESICLTDEQIKRGLKDDNYYVVLRFISRRDSFRLLDTKTVDYLIRLPEPHNSIKYKLLSKVMNFTKEQLQFLLCHNDDYTRRLVAGKEDITLSEKQIEYGLIDQCPNVRMEFAKRTDFRPNRMQVDRGIRDQSYNVVLAFIDRDDITLTPEQIAYILDESKSRTLISTLKDRGHSTNHGKNSAILGKYLVNHNPISNFY